MSGATCEPGEGSISADEIAEAYPSPGFELRSKPPSPTRGEGAPPLPPQFSKHYAPYTDPFGSGNTGSCVRILVGHTTVMRSPAFCITTGVERSFWPAIGAPGG